MRNSWSLLVLAIAGCAADEGVELSYRPEHISGSPLLGYTIPPTAVGGRQTIEVQGFEGAIVVSVIGGSLTVEQDGSLVALTGVAEGAATLRIEDAQGSLLDEVEVRAEAVVGFELQSVALGFYRDELDRPYAVLAGVDTPVAVIVLGEGGRVVDEGLRIGAPALNEQNQPLYDVIELLAPSAPLVLEVESGDVTGTVEVPVVDAIDGGRMFSEDGAVVTVDDIHWVCAVATSGAYDVRADWTLTVEGDAHELVPDLFPILFRPANCIPLEVERAGSAVVTATGPAGIVRTLELTIED